MRSVLIGWLRSCRLGVHVVQTGPPCRSVRLLHLYTPLLARKEPSCKLQGGSRRLLRSMTSSVAYRYGTAFNLLMTSKANGLKRSKQGCRTLSKGTSFGISGTERFSN